MHGQQADEMFEQLLVLRRCYDLRSDYDRRAILNIPAALDYGEWRMRLARLSELRRGIWSASRGSR